MQRLYVYKVYKIRTYTFNIFDSFRIFHMKACSVNTTIQRFTNLPQLFSSCFNKCLCVQISKKIDRPNVQTTRLNYIYISVVYHNLTYIWGRPIFCSSVYPKTRDWLVVFQSSNVWFTNFKILEKSLPNLNKVNYIL